jgi:hypothetical protein
MHSSDVLVGGQKNQHSQPLSDESVTDVEQTREAPDLSRAVVRKCRLKRPLVRSAGMR